MGYMRTAVKGVGWMGALRFLTRGLGLLRIIILARLLTPEDFGLFGIAAITLAFVETMTETGISLALVQQEEEIDGYVNTAWVISIARGFGITALIILSSWLIVSFFQQPKAWSLTLAIAIIPAVKGFINPGAVEFIKKLQFHKEFILRAFPMLIDMILATYVAILTRSALALVYGMIAAAIAEVVLSRWLARVRPHFAFDETKARRMMQYGKWVNVGGILSYFSEQLDDIVVGRYLGAASLGIYQMAFKLAVLPARELAEVVTKVVFPVFARILTDKDRLSRAVRKTTLTLVSISLPIAVLFIFFPEPLIRLLLGDQWLAAAKPLSILAVYGAVIASSQGLSVVLFAAGKPDVAAKLRMIHVAGLVVLLLLLTGSYQLVGVSLAVTASSLATLPFLWARTQRLLRSEKRGDA